MTKNARIKQSLMTAMNWEGYSGKQHDEPGYQVGRSEALSKILPKNISSKKAAMWERLAKEV